MRDQKQAPVADAEISLQSSAGDPIATTHTDSNGAYRFAQVRPGTYKLHVTTSSAGNATSALFSAGNSTTQHVDLTLSAPASALRSSPDFFDQPSFTVAGVTDTTNLGGHGSDTITRTKDSLAKDVASLSNARGATTKSDSHTMVQPNDSSEAHHLAAENYERSGDSLHAVQQYQRAAELDPSETNVFDWGAELLLHHAAQPAVEVFSEGLRRYPKSPRLLTALGIAWYVNGSFEKAISALGEASDLEPDQPTPYLFLGKIMSVEPNPSQEITLRLERFLQRLPQNPLANYYAALSVLKQTPADNIKAESLLKRAAQLDPNFADAHLQLGVMYSDEHDLTRAVSELQKASSADPTSPESHYRLAQLYRRKGDAPHAKHELELYQQLTRDSAAQVERERHQIQQFVYTMHDRQASRH